MAGLAVKYNPSSLGVSRANRGGGREVLLQWW